MTRTALKMLFKRWKAIGATTPTKIEEKGHYDDIGDWVKPQITEVNTPIDCAILPLRASVITGSSGVYTNQDREIYLYHALTPKQEINYKDVTYTVEDELDTSDFTGVFIYTLKAVSPFAER